VLTIDDLLGALRLEQVGDDRYRATNADAGHGVIFGGQLLAQSIIAGLDGHDDKQVKTVHTVFARGGKPDLPVEIDVDRMHRGRAFASSTVTIRQGERLCTRSLVLLTADEPDFIRHADPAPTVPVPERPGREAPESGDTRPDGDVPPGHDGGDWQVRIAGDVDIDDPALVGPADLDVWTRFAGAPDDAATDQALLAFATDGFLIATAMRPHEGVGQALAHRTVSTGVVSHTLTFHEPAPASEWLLLAHHSPYAGRGRSYGCANVYRPDGTMVASFVQDAMIRLLDTSRPGAR
jgi:acyl-CoA thioesterase